MDKTRFERRRFLARALGAVGTLGLAGCERLSHTEWFPKVLGAGETASAAVARAVTSRTSMAQEFAESDRSPTFRSNGTAEPNSDLYRALAANAFADYRLRVDGLVAQPASLSLAELRALPSRTQITRHDCVEGWSASATWTGVRLRDLLDRVGAPADATVRITSLQRRGPFRVSEMASTYARDDLTLLALRVNGEVLAPDHGYPARIIAPNRPGVLQTKWVNQLEAL